MLIIIITIAVYNIVRKRYFAKHLNKRNVNQ